MAKQYRAQFCRCASSIAKKTRCIETSSNRLTTWRNTSEGSGGEISCSKVIQRQSGSKPPSLTRGLEPLLYYLEDISTFFCATVVQATSATQFDMSSSTCLEFPPFKWRCYEHVDVPAEGFPIPINTSMSSISMRNPCRLPNAKPRRRISASSCYFSSLSRGSWVDA